MLLFASPTNGQRNRAALSQLGYGFIVSPHTERLLGGWDGPLVLDNGAWTCHQSKVAFDFDAFMAFCGRMVSKQPRWVIAPDVVGDLGATITLAETWVPILRSMKFTTLVAAQDGAKASDFVHLGVDGIALGGSSEWKEQQLRDHQWSNYRIRHALRVNTRRRLHAAIEGGWTSCDGSGATRFSIHAARMRAWCSEPFQTTLWGT